MPQFDRRTASGRKRRFQSVPMLIETDVYRKLGSHIHVSMPTRL